MKKQSDIQDLSDKIEQLVQAHMAQVRAQAEGAIARAFGAATKAPCAPPAGGPKLRGRNSSTRRTPDEIASMAERLWQRVSVRPGDTMATIATELGTTARELHKPMSKLRAAGRVRTAGERHFTKYFPMTEAVEASA